MDKIEHMAHAPSDVRTTQFRIDTRRDTKGNMIKDNKNLQVRPKNWTVPVVLVLLREEGSHGYELMERLEEFGFEEVDAGTLYRTLGGGGEGGVRGGGGEGAGWEGGGAGTLSRTLRRMEKEGLCESEWETSESGPARRTYSVTDAGEEELAAWAEGCERYRNSTECFCAAT